MVASCLLLYWLYAEQGMVVTTAPTKQHVEDVLWPEAHKLRRGSRVFLPASGEFLTKIVLDPTWYAYGITTNKASAFQGRHHPRLLVLIDEAANVEEPVHLEISTLVTDPENCLAMIGNPTNTSGTFYEAFRNPDVWTCLTASCFEHPNVLQGKTIIPGAVSRGWIDDRRRTWGEDHPFWYARVLGEFPELSDRALISLRHVERACNKEAWLHSLAEAQKLRYPRVAGLDVARYGQSKTVLTVRRHNTIEEQIDWSHRTLTETCGLVMQHIREKDLALVMVDASGIGAGVVDRLLELGAPVQAYNGGHRAFTPGSFSNRRTEMWWYLRMRFERGLIYLPPNVADQLIRDLVAPEYTISSSGRIKMQTKEDMLLKGIKSPDWGDSLVLAYAMDENPEEELRAPIVARHDSRVQDEEELLPPVPPSERDWFATLPKGF